MDPATGGLQLKSALFAFHRLCGSHNGKSMAATVIHLLDCADTTATVCESSLLSNYCDLITIPQVGH
jgi:hypothetical protein